MTENQQKLAKNDPLGSQMAHYLRKLKRLKAIEILDTVYIDDATYYPEEIDKWIEDVTNFLKIKENEIKSWFLWSMNK